MKMGVGEFVEGEEGEGSEGIMLRVFDFLSNLASPSVKKEQIRSIPQYFDTPNERSRSF
jgi:hypothetical protein